MSLRHKTEIAFKGVIDDAATGIQVLTSQNSQETTKQKARVVVRVLGGQQISPKAKVLRQTVVVSIESPADKARSSDTDPVDDHIARVSAIDAALNNVSGGLAAALNSKRTLPAVAGFYCSGVVPQGDYDDPPSPEDRMFRDSLAYTVTVCGSDND